MFKEPLLPKSHNPDKYEVESQASTSLSDFPELPFEEKMLRRETMSDLSQTFEESKKMVDRGIDIGGAEQMRDYITKLQDFDSETVNSGKDLLIDAHAVQQYSGLLLSNLNQYKDQNKTSLNMKLFVQRLKRHAYEINSMKSIFETIGRENRYMFQSLPAFSYLRPIMHLQLELRIKKERVKVERTKDVEKQVVLKAKTKKEVQEESNKTTLAIKLDLVNKSLKKALKGLDSDRVNFYRFIIDPHDFGKSVENMFYTSFLIKDGYLTLEVDPETGLPDIMRTSIDNRYILEKTIDRSKWECTQYIAKFTWQYWEKFTLFFKIKEPMIQRSE